MSLPHAMFAAGSASLFDDLFDKHAVARLRSYITLDDELLTADLTDIPARARDVELLITGWGAPRFDAEMLSHWPNLRAIVHAAGSVKRLVTPDLWDRGIRVSSCAQANAYPVAEYTLAMILLSVKRTLESSREFASTQNLLASLPSGRFGAFGVTVGIIGASRIGRRVIELLRPFDIRCLLYDPSLTDAEARALGAQPATLAELLTRSDVVTVHAPSLPETRRMIGREQLALMRDDAVLINTARGALVDTDALVAEVASGRLRAVLDVTDPEPLPPGHPLFTLPGVTLTPHVAGSLGNELQRIGSSVVDEVERYVTSDELAGEVTSPDLAKIA
ncbi:hydroxyacid dehydrogenase [Microbacterium trichothecenolyticum]|uniref:Formate dehydrogenase n=1 Tax=Microbacterium trichothecenolyticum TaxID=69370 RepID=A0A0M2HAG0_MICTR|nr:hydroxyacid dehydrogenase [Microbacterium trichothecenolyticum]KJL41649.1 Formate dehydrogenase [Microbacterium trichothecenolyticum]